jgi:hypothetical protein
MRRAAGFLNSTAPARKGGQKIRKQGKDSAVLQRLDTATKARDTMDTQSNDELVGADLIVYNAKIATQNLAQPEASALAVKRGRIYAVGSDA